MKPLPERGVGVTAVHEAVEIYVLEVILLGDVAEREDMLERGVYAAVGCQAHEVHGLAGVLGVGECVLDFGILKDGTVGDGLVDFHEVLIDHAACADVEVSYFRVAHLAVGQADVFA